MILNPQSNYCSYPTTPTVLLDRPDIGVDRRTTGTGAGDVYVTYTHFFGYYPTTQIELIACKNNFASASDCSPPQVISGIDTKTQFSNVSVRSNGTVTVTYVDVDSTTTQSGKSLQFFNIKYVSCTPNGAPSSPTCNSPVLVTSEYQPLAIGSTLTDNSFRIATYPKHVERADGTARLLRSALLRISPEGSGSTMPVLAPILTALEAQRQIASARERPELRQNVEALEAVVSERLQECRLGHLEALVEVEEVLEVSRLLLDAKRLLGNDG